MGICSAKFETWFDAETCNSINVGTSYNNNSSSPFDLPLGEEWSDYPSTGKSWPNQIIGPYTPIQPPLKDPSDMSDLQDLLEKIQEQHQTSKEDEVKSLKDEVTKLAGQLKKLRTEFNKLKKQLRPPPKPGQRQLEL